MLYGLFFGQVHYYRDKIPRSLRLHYTAVIVSITKNIDIASDDDFTNLDLKLEKVLLDSLETNPEGFFFHHNHQKKEKQKLVKAQHITSSHAHVQSQSQSQSQSPSHHLGNKGNVVEIFASAYCPYHKCSFGRCSCGKVRLKGKRIVMLRKIADARAWYTKTGIPIPILPMLNSYTDSYADAASATATATATAPPRIEDRTKKLDEFPDINSNSGWISQK
jgi:hypothetical protein